MPAPHMRELCSLCVTQITLYQKSVPGNMNTYINKQVRTCVAPSQCYGTGVSL